MGQAYCQTCCGQKNLQVYTTMEDRKLHTVDKPSPDFAKSVRQYIELNSKVKEIFTQNRISHVPQRKGNKLQLYYLFQYAAYYDGQWDCGLPHGFGRLIYDDGSIYEGCFFYGTAECRDALFVKNNGSFYKGGVKANKAYGFGVLNSDKFYYKGYWLNDLPNGEGQEVYMKGYLPHYQGNFKNGKKEGLGIYYWNQRQYYSGQFKNNKIHGKGRHVTKELDYKGEFIEGLKDGKGILVNTLKNWKYEGQFKKNKMDGMGTIIWDDKTKFEGEFEENERKKGKLFLCTGQIVQEEGQ